MASKRRLRRNMCGKKIAYRNLTEAIAALIAHKKKFDETNIHTYRCKFCKKFHLGHYDNNKSKPK